MHREFLIHVLYVMSFYSTCTGVTLSFMGPFHTQFEGANTLLCITASGSIPDSYSIDISLLSVDGTAQAGLGKIIP